jgi:hypothetical protein
MLEWDPKGKQGPMTPIPHMATIHIPMEEEEFKCNFNGFLKNLKLRTGLELEINMSHKALSSQLGS